VQIYVRVFFYIVCTPTCFDSFLSSSAGFKNLYFAKLRKFLKLRLLILQFHKIMQLKLFKYI
jgi:hypothetical protein